MQSVTILGFDPRTAEGNELTVLLAALGKHGLEARWRIMEDSTSGEDVWVLGAAHRDFSELAVSGRRISGASLLRLSKNLDQVIAADFHGYCDISVDMPWIIISIFEGTLEIHSVDERIVGQVRDFFDVSRTKVGRSALLEKMLPRRH